MSSFDLQKIEQSMISHELRSCLLWSRQQLVMAYYREPVIRDQLYRINSCTKSILSALLGIAHDQGRLPALRTPISAFYPIILEEGDPLKQQITIEHLLSMTSGIAWSEFRGLNSFPEMIQTPNWNAYTLSQPMAEAPGERMVYSSGNSQLLSGVLASCTGMSVAAFAEAYLFGPLGIDSYLWETDPQSLHTGGYGLQLRPQDLLRIGQLFLQQGRWEGRQLLSSSWIQQSTMPRIRTEQPRQGYYGWHWWISQFHTDEQPDVAVPYYFALGFGGQYIIVVPSYELVAVITQDKLKKRKKHTDVFLQHIAKALRS